MESDKLIRLMSALPFLTTGVWVALRAIVPCCSYPYTRVLRSVILSRIQGRDPHARLVRLSLGDLHLLRRAPRDPSRLKGLAR